MPSESTPILAFFVGHPGDLLLFLDLYPICGWKPEADRRVVKDALPVRGESAAAAEAPAHLRGAPQGGQEWPPDRALQVQVPRHWMPR